MDGLPVSEWLLDCLLLSYCIEQDISWNTKTERTKIPQGKKLDNIYRWKKDDISFPKLYVSFFYKFFPSKFEILQDYSVEYNVEYSPVEFRPKNRFDGKIL